MYGGFILGLIVFIEGIPAISLWRCITHLSGSTLHLSTVTHISLTSITIGFPRSDLINNYFYDRSNNRAAHHPDILAALHLTLPSYRVVVVVYPLPWPLQVGESSRLWFASQLLRPSDRQCTPAWSVYKSRGDNVMRMCVLLKR